MLKQLQGETELFVKKEVAYHEDDDCDIFETNIQENLEDEFVQDALNKGLDLKKYSQEVENDLKALEKSSIRDCKFKQKT